MNSLFFVFQKMKSFLKKLKWFCPTLQELFKNARDSLKISLDVFQKSLDELSKRSRRVFLFFLMDFVRCLYSLYTCRQVFQPFTLFTFSMNRVFFIEIFTFYFVLPIYSLLLQSLLLPKVRYGEEQGWETYT